MKAIFVDASTPELPLTREGTWRGVLKKTSVLGDAEKRNPYDLYKLPVDI